MLSQQNKQKITEQTLQAAIQKLARKYEAIITMVAELQDNLNQVIQVSYALLKEKDAKIVELQTPVKAIPSSTKAKEK